MKDRDRLMKKWQMYNFACVEANLFLDTHPDDRDALDYLKKMLKMREAAQKEYAERFGMINISDIGDDATYWEWVKSPWPWMNDCEARM